MSEKEIIFCSEYIIDFNGQRAATAAGYSERTARSKASQLLTKVNIQQRLSELKAERVERLEASADSVLQELLNWASGDYTELMLLSTEQIKELSPEIRRLITGYKRTVRTIPGTKPPETEIQIEVKFVDKQKAMDMIAKHIGFYEKDNHQSKDKIVVNNLDLSRVSSETLKALKDSQKKGD